MKESDLNNCWLVRGRRTWRHSVVSVPSGTCPEREKSRWYSDGESTSKKIYNNRHRSEI